MFVRATQDKIVKWWPGEVIARKSPATYWIRVNGRDRLYHVDKIKDNATNLQYRPPEKGPLAEALLTNEDKTIHQEAENNDEAAGVQPSNDPGPAQADETIVRRSNRPSKPPLRYIP